MKLTALLKKPLLISLILALALRAYPQEKVTCSTVYDDPLKGNLFIYASPGFFNLGTVSNNFGYDAGLIMRLGKFATPYFNFKHGYSAPTQEYFKEFEGGNITVNPLSANSFMEVGMVIQLKDLLSVNNTKITLNRRSSTSRGYAVSTTTTTENYIMLPVSTRSSAGINLGYFEMKTSSYFKENYSLSYKNSENSTFNLVGTTMIKFPVYFFGYSIMSNQNYATECKNYGLRKLKAYSQINLDLLFSPKIFPEDFVVMDNENPQNNGHYNLLDSDAKIRKTGFRVSVRSIMSFGNASIGLYRLPGPAKHRLFFTMGIGLALPLNLAFMAPANIRQK